MTANDTLIHTTLTISYIDCKWVLLLFVEDIIVTEYLINTFRIVPLFHRLIYLLFPNISKSHFNWCLLQLWNIFRMQDNW